MNEPQVDILFIVFFFLDWKINFSFKLHLKDHTGHSPASSNSECDESSLNASSLRRKLFTQMNTTPQAGDSDVYVS